MENAFVIEAMVGTMHQMEIAVNTEKQLLIDLLWIVLWFRGGNTENIY